MYILWKFLIITNKTLIVFLFRLPKGNEIDDVDEEYDAAFSATQSCEKLYPNCNKNVESPFIAFWNKLICNII